MTQIVIIDYGMGNLRSVEQALHHVAVDMEIVVSGDESIINNADKVIFPGVGAIGHCLEELDKRGLTKSVVNAAAEKPMLAICVGMQALFDNSEESNHTKGLGIISGNVPKFPDVVTEQGLCVPHMGWNGVTQSMQHPLFDGIASGERFYFVHSFYCEPKTPDVIASHTDHGIQFCSSVASNNIFATQFHPEKSHEAGLKLLKNFSLWSGI